MVISPNPSDGEFTMMLNNPIEGKMTISVYDVTNKAIIIVSTYVPKGSYQKTLQMPGNTTSGIYFVNVTLGEHQITQKVLITK